MLPQRGGKRTTPLPVVICPEDDFWGIMEVLIGRALSAFQPVDPTPTAIVGARRDGALTIFSVHTAVPGAFKSKADADLSPDSPEYRVWEAKAIIERNGGRLWADERHGIGSTAYFTIRG